MAYVCISEWVLVVICVCIRDVSMSLSLVHCVGIAYLENASLDCGVCVCMCGVRLSI